MRWLGQLSTVSTADRENYSLKYSRENVNILCTYRFLIFNQFLVTKAKLYNKCRDGYNTGSGYAGFLHLSELHCVRSVRSRFSRSCKSTRCWIHDQSSKENVSTIDAGTLGAGLQYLVDQLTLFQPGECRLSSPITTFSPPASLNLHGSLDFTQLYNSLIIILQATKIWKNQWDALKL